MAAAAAVVVVEADSALTTVKEEEADEAMKREEEEAVMGTDHVVAAEAEDLEAATEAAAEVRPEEMKTPLVVEPLLLGQDAARELTVSSRNLERSK